VACDFSRAVFEGCAVWLADDGEELVDGVVCVDSDDFASQIFEFYWGFWYEIFEVYTQKDTVRIMAIKVIINLLKITKTTFSLDSL
jgi:hypothetical protein